ncbi:TCR/Tet family MFS transporter [Argonema antarcticum]|uniref:TCR/Tet family MFS transporter n=1 Tax=Argonema antarcticum TaxID=2942763 RepID=UPI002010F859|nr:TCR/Tet family MFS transporter [Argonema antarcticum]MCL1470228.1 TCR/Tet family MFS transporter [Argonema antarcticum A004/B2]
MMKLKRPPGLIFVLITLFIDVMGVGLSAPILPKLIAGFIGDVSTASYYYGAVTTSYALMLFVFSPIQGALSDRFGRKPVLLFSLFGTGLTYIGLTFAPTLPWIFTAQILNGLTGGSVAVVFAYIADVSTPEERPKNFGLVGAVLALGWVVGPALGGLLGAWGLRFPFAVAAIITFLNLLYGILVVSESHSPEHRRSFSWSRANPVASLGLLRKNAIVFGLAAIMLCTDIALQCFISTWVLFTTYKFAWTTVQAGLSLALLGVMTAAVQGGLIRPLISRFGSRKIIIVGLTFSMIGYLLYAFATAGWMLYWIIVLNGFDFTVKPTAQGLVSAQVSSQEQGAIQGALSSLTALASIIGPLLATNLFGYFTSDRALIRLPEIPFFLGAFLFGLALWLAIATFSKRRLV